MNCPTCDRYSGDPDDESEEFFCPYCDGDFDDDDEDEEESDEPDFFDRIVDVDSE